MRTTLIVSVLSFLFLASCDEKVKTIEVSAKPIETTPLSLPDPDKLVLQKIQWTIVTEDNIEEVFSELQPGNKVLFALTEEGYKALSLNLSELRRYISQQKSIIVGYRDYYERGR